MTPLPRPNPRPRRRPLARRLVHLLLAVAVGTAATAATASGAAHAAPDAKKSVKHETAAKTARSKSQAGKAGKPARAGAARTPKKRAVSAYARRIDYAGEQVNFGQWKAVSDFADQMADKHGFERAELDTLISQVNFIESAVQLVKPAPPGKPKNWRAYSELIVEPIRIDGGIAFWNEHAEALERAEAQYGVPAEIIVGIIGVETVYGRNTGRFRVIDTLTTLAFAYPAAPNRDVRMDFFRGELENTLLLARKYNIDPLSLQGSFAGAVGLPQFMPGSILKYAVDFDGDGLVDLRQSPVDAIGSVANFLVQHGWQREHQGPIVYAANVSPSRAWDSFIDQGLSAKFPAAELAAAGVASNSPLPPSMLFGLVDLQNGADPTEYWLATDNFFAITKYNRSYFYAMSVVELGRAVRVGRGSAELH